MYQTLKLVSALYLRKCETAQNPAFVPSKMNRKITVNTYNDVAEHNDIDTRTADNITTLLKEQLRRIVHVPTWIIDENDIPTTTIDDNLVAGEIEDHSEKSLRLSHGGEPHYLPKSQVLVFERAENYQDIESPQTDLGGFEVAQ